MDRFILTGFQRDDIILIYCNLFPTVAVVGTLVQKQEKDTYIQRRHKPQNNTTAQTTQNIKQTYKTRKLT